MFAAMHAANSPRPTQLQSNWRSTRSTVGDTEIVRTLSGSVWRDTMMLSPELAVGSAAGTTAFLFGRIGAIDIDSSGNIYVLDAAAREVRVFSPGGAHVRTFGRAGAGPGEFQSPNELRVTRDGRAIVREQAVRMSLFDVQGVFVRSWPLGSTFSSGAPVYITRDSRVLNRTLRDKLVWYSLDGAPLDTVALPALGPAPPTLQFAVPGGRSSYGIPFTASTVWTLTVDGKLVAGYNGSYAFDVKGGAGQILRIARDAPAARVAAAEARSIRESMTRYIRQSAGSDWRWDGTDIPAVNLPISPCTAASTAPFGSLVIQSPRKCAILITTHHAPNAVRRPYGHRPGWRTCSTPPAGISER
jgi:hypothetical protein